MIWLGLALAFNLGFLACALTVMWLVHRAYAKTELVMCLDPDCVEHDREELS